MDKWAGLSIRQREEMPLPIGALSARDIARTEEQCYEHTYCARRHLLDRLCYFSHWDNLLRGVDWSARY